MLSAGQNGECNEDLNTIVKILFKIVLEPDFYNYAKARCLIWLKKKCFHKIINIYKPNLVNRIKIKGFT